jgi:riboflavin synthase
MFTGLVQGVGCVVDVERLAADGGVRLTIDGGAVAGFRPTVGDSIALNGACMTATSVDGARFTVDVSRESLSKTAGLDGAGDVNIETSMALGDKLGGHLVAGHVDGVGEVVRFEPVHESWELVVRAPRELAKYFAYKGSVAVNGVSLTVNRVDDTPAGCEFSINIIPHTFEVTTLRSLRPGSRVNLEADLIARYVERMLSLERAWPGAPSSCSPTARETRAGR